MNKVGTQPRTIELDRDTVDASSLASKSEAQDQAHAVPVCEKLGSVVSNQHARMRALRV